LADDISCPRVESTAQATTGAKPELCHWVAKHTYFTADEVTSLKRYASADFRCLSPSELALIYRELDGRFNALQGLETVPLSEHKPIN
jgi:hypothetical protein